MKAVQRIGALALAVVVLALGEQLMADEANLWIIDEDPVAEGRPATNLELLGVQKTMGPGGVRKSVEALVTLNEPLVFAPPGGVAAAGTSHDYYLVRLPFTAHPLSGDRNYDRLELRVKLGDPAAMGFMLIPDAVVTEEDVKRTWDISAGFERAGLKLGGGGSYIVGFKRIVPIVRAFGESSPVFYWRFEREEAGPPLLGDHITLVILRVPRGSKTVSGELYAEGLIESRFPWIFGKQQEVFSDHEPVSWDLAKAEPFEAIRWIKEVTKAPHMQPQ